MNIKTKFNVGNIVYIVKGIILKHCIDGIEINAFGNTQKETQICYRFRDGFSGSFLKHENEVFSTKEEAIKYLNNNVLDNTCEKSYVD